MYAIVLFLFTCLLLGANSRQQQPRQVGDQVSLTNRNESAELDAIDHELHDIESDATAIRRDKFRNRFLQFYGLAVAADWLQSPFVYSLYTSKGFSDSGIAALFATSFLFSGLSALFVGPLADRYGRKQACLLFCVLFSLSSLTVISDSIWTLALGRALAGVSATLSSTVFEMWLLTEYQRHGFGHAEEALMSVHSAMSATKGFVAIAAGITSQFLVRSFESDTAPFMASVVCLVSLSFLISKHWVENYGYTSTGAAPSVQTDSMSLLAFGSAVFAMEASLCIVTTFWPVCITSARDAAFAWAKGKLPFGLIFASFMCASTLGSIGFTHMSSRGNSVKTSSLFVQLALVVCSMSMLMVVPTQAEAFRFLAFCIFQASVGFYGPSISFLKGRLIEIHQREKVYGVIQLFLNLFVVGALVTVDDDEGSRDGRFMTCGGLLLLATILMTLFVPNSFRSR